MKFIKKILKDIEIIIEECTNEFYVRYFNKGHYELHNMKSQEFKAYLNNIYGELSNEDKVPNMNQQLENLKADAIQNNKFSNIYTRIEGDIHEIHYFLSDEKWQSLKITEKGWDILSDKEMYFKKSPNSTAQVCPSTNGNIDLLREYVNLDNDSYLMFLCYLVHCLIPIKSHFAAIISSEKGSGKTTISKLIRKIIDPVKVTTTICPKSEKELANHLINNKIISFDNTKPLSDEFSDMLCSAITGSGISLRTLYTTSDEKIFTVQSILLLNGIDIIPSQSDLIDRAILFELLPLNNGNRKSDESLWQSFEEDLPSILGGIFDLVSLTLKELPYVKINKQHRMLASYQVMIATAIAIGKTQNEFEKIFWESIEKLNFKYAANNDFTSQICDIMRENDNKKIKGYVSEVYKKINTEFTLYPTFPKSPQKFSQFLRKHKESLEKLGYIVNFEIDNKGTIVCLYHKKENV
ncbi:MAG: hypothetical protein RR710_02815 [Oscillospiraceae bacterium]